MRDNIEKFDSHGKLKWALSTAWLLAIVTVAFLYNLGNIGLMDKTEAMFVEAAREMVDSGDWITPYWNGETRFDKPPLTYWLISGGVRTFRDERMDGETPVGPISHCPYRFGLLHVIVFRERVSPVRDSQKGCFRKPGQSQVLEIGLDRSVGSRAQSHMDCLGAYRRVRYAACRQCRPGHVQLFYGIRA